MNAGTSEKMIQKLAAKQAQSAAYDWLRLKTFQITDLRDRLSTIGKYPLSILWGFDDSAYGLAADLGEGCRAAQWGICTPEKLPDSMEALESLFIGKQGISLSRKPWQIRSKT